MSTIIVAHNSLSSVRETIPSLVDQLESSDELIVVDSGSSDEIARELPTLAPRACLVSAPGNVGFAKGANLGVAAATGDLVVLVNPDVVVEPGWADAMRSAWAGPWDGWMALVTMHGGTEINTSGGVLHYTGLGWAGQAGQPVVAGPRLPAEVGFLSGACLAMARTAWIELGGFSEHFFMYCEDVDLSLRIRLRGGRVAVLPDARVVHDYDFAKGPLKWRLLERNRWATIVRTYPRPLLMLVMPALLATEAAIWAAALRGGWARMKALATVDFILALPRLARERRAIQATRHIDAATFASAMTSELSSPYLGVLGRNTAVRRALGVYWGLVCSLLSSSSRWA
jgi:N-acetylglucosaminyl-diphospho-decaprenol L-rhamnosyltransferase